MQAFHNSSMFTLQHIFPWDMRNAFHYDPSNPIFADLPRHAKKKKKKKLLLFSFVVLIFLRQMCSKIA